MLHSARIAPGMAGEFWPALHPPLLNRLPTTATQPREVIPSTLEIEIEQMDRDEDRFANQVSQPLYIPDQLQ